MRPIGQRNLGSLRVAPALLLVAGVSFCAAEPVALQLAERAPVTADWILFRDLLAVPVTSAPAELLDAAIAPSPLPGTTRTLPAGLIRLRLRRAGADLSLWSLTGPAQVQVSRPATPQVAAAPMEPSQAPAEVRAAEMLRRGTGLRIVVRCGALVIETTGRLMQDAAVGQMAPLQVDTTRAVVIGQIIDPKRAEVLL